MDDRMFIEEKDLAKRKVMMEEWINQNSAERPTIEEVDHIIDCFETIYNWYEKSWSPGGFTTAVLKNDFKEACFHADQINRKNLYIYALFLHWHIPNNYHKKVKDL